MISAFLTMRDRNRPRRCRRKKNTRAAEGRLLRKISIHFLDKGKMIWQEI